MAFISVAEPMVGVVYERTHPSAGKATVVGIAEHHITMQRNVVYRAETGKEAGQLFVTSLRDFSLRFRPGAN